FLVTPIRPPTVPEGTSRLRFTFTAGHQDDDIMRLVEAVRPFLPKEPISQFPGSSPDRA
ncbi:MAG: hypothetical protein O2912_04365, partial [Proteobacteria bacterium]|nr:hypothetical protein [Pseudomonadota bacterium]